MYVLEYLWLVYREGRNCKLNTVRKRVKNVVTGREFQWGLSVNK
jgi:hypothetical protein